MDSYGCTVRCQDMLMMTAESCVDDNDEMRYLLTEWAWMLKNSYIMDAIWVVRTVYYYVNGSKYLYKS